MLALHFFDRARDRTLVLQGDPSVAIGIDHHVGSVTITDGGCGAPIVALSR